MSKQKKKEFAIDLTEASLWTRIKACFGLLVFRGFYITDPKEIK